MVNETGTTRKHPSNGPFTPRFWPQNLSHGHWWRQVTCTTQTDQRVSPTNCKHRRLSGKNIKGAHFHRIEKPQNSPLTPAVAAAAAKPPPPPGESPCWVQDARPRPLRFRKTPTRLLATHHHRRFVLLPVPFAGSVTVNSLQNATRPARFFFLRTCAVPGAQL